ncbi:SCAN domain containing protein 3, partial [Dissostichus eleginoides]
AYFGSTYLCETAFSQMKIIKSKYRTRMTDAHLTDCLRLAITNYQPDFKRLTDNVQSQQSH